MGSKAGYGICLLFAACAIAQTTDDTLGVPDYTVEHPECALFGPNYNKLVAKAVNSSGPTPHQAAISALTSQVAGALGFIPSGSRTDIYQKEQQAAQAG